MLSFFPAHRGQELGGRFNAQPVAQRRHEMPPVVSDHHRRAGRARVHVGNMRIVRCAPLRSILGRRSQKLEPIAGRKVVDRDPSEDLLFQQVHCIGWREAELGRQPRGDGKEFEAAVPGRRCAPNGVLRHGMHHRLRRSALRSEVDQPASSTLVSRNTVTATGFAPLRPALRCQSWAANRRASWGGPRGGGRFFEPWARRNTLQTNAGFVDGDLELGPGREAGVVPDRGGNDHPACLVDGCSHGIKYTIFMTGALHHCPGGRTSARPYRHRYAISMTRG